MGFFKADPPIAREKIDNIFERIAKYYGLEGPNARIAVEGKPREDLENFMHRYENLLKHSGLTVSVELPAHPDDALWQLKMGTIKYKVEFEVDGKVPPGEVKVFFYSPRVVRDPIEVPE